MRPSKIPGLLIIFTAALLFMLGVAVCVTGISVHIVYLYDKYQGFAENGYFDSFLHYYCAVGKGNLVASILLGAIPVAIGFFLLRKLPSGADPS